MSTQLGELIDYQRVGDYISKRRYRFQISDETDFGTGYMCLGRHRTGDDPTEQIVDVVTPASLPAAFRDALVSGLAPDGGLIQHDTMLAQLRALPRPGLRKAPVLKKTTIGNSDRVIEYAPSPYSFQGEYNAPEAGFSLRNAIFHAAMTGFGTLIMTKNPRAAVGVAVAEFAFEVAPEVGSYLSSVTGISGEDFAQGVNLAKSLLIEGE